VANEKATVRAMPVYMGFFVVISLLIFFPALSLWLPWLMGVY
jgi:TRAP-type C4-dicarboxylate transport system permease large subunit